MLSRRLLMSGWWLAVCGGLLTGQPLPGTQPLVMDGDLAAQMVEGIHRYLDRELARNGNRPGGLFHLRRIIGAVDARVDFEAPALVARLGGTAQVAEGHGYRVYAVRWPVLEGVEAEGLLLEPKGTPVARVVALGDADWTPEMLAGLAPGAPAELQFARQLAASGCLVLAPVLIDRSDTFSANPRIGRFTNQPHREFIYRMAYEMGRHIIGYEVQKVMAAVDWFARSQPRRPIGVAGYGEGGLVALHSAALDARIEATLVSGYFRSRRGVWEEPIYRNVWGLLKGFGDAELARLVAPRGLVIEASRHPEVAGPPPERERRRGAAPGLITTPEFAEVRAECARAGTKPVLVERGGARELLRMLAPNAVFRDRPGGTGLQPVARRAEPPVQRMQRQVEQLVDHTQRLVRASEAARREFWAQVDATSLDRWRQTVEPCRRRLWEEVIGRLPDPSEPLAARTRRAYDEAAWTGYEVVLPVWPEVYAYGILLVPKDLKPGERRPVVVCQHGLEGRPQDTIEAKGEKAYARFAARLAEAGYVVYSPQNPYIGRDRFRQIQRKANPLELSLFSFIVGQHQRTLEWLASLPFVDGERIGFYGLSYGGKTAVRVPPLLPGYALSICSADFNEWIRKNTSVDEPFSYMYTGEYEMPEFNLGNTFNYAELAALMVPRPFMVERGHRDGVGIDEWVAYEYAKVRRLYTFLGVGERTTIEFFNGPHRIHGVGTFEFLRRWLEWR